MNYRIGLITFALLWSARADKPVDFQREIMPLLSDSCLQCHGPDKEKAEGKFQIDSFEHATLPRKRGPGVVAGDPNKSLVWKLINSTDPDDQMPPPDKDIKPFSKADKELIRRWIKQGAVFEKHWSFVTPKKPAVPKSSERNPIDAFVARGLTKAKTRFAPEADKATLARRVALVLTGLPPEPEQLAAYMADKGAKAYEKLVDKLLASPRFGEHQARYWLDAIRYGDTHGLHLDGRRGIYPFRDWVVESYNRNKSFDQFIVEQLAGDLLPRPTLRQRVATGFVRMNPSTSEGGAIPDEFQAKNNFDRTETFGTALLGLTLNCARCHTHKYDPLQHKEYYQLFAFFNHTSEHSMDGNKYAYAPVLRVPATPKAWAAWDALQAKLKKTPKDQKLKQQVGALRRGFTTTLVAGHKRRKTYLLKRGEYHLKDKELGDLSPGVFAVLGGLPKDAPKNRLSLAKWLVDRKNPLVSRVLINRIWQQTFGVGLVRTPEDFGIRGELPTHPDLLDWLAVEWQDRKWDQKKMIRLMVTSRTFKQVSARRKTLRDPDNRLLARGPSWRLDAEVIRDIGLWAAGHLNEEMGGAGIKPPQPSGLWAILSHPASNTKRYVADKGAKIRKRSLYIYWKRTSPHPMMTLIDAPSRESSCVVRSRTSTPLGSLAMLNEGERQVDAAVLAVRLLSKGKETRERLDQLFTLITCKQPDTAQRKTCETLLQDLIKKYAQKPKEAAEVLQGGRVQKLKNVSAAEQAAWTLLCSAILASDLNILLN